MEAGMDAYQAVTKDTAVYPKEKALEYLGLGLAGEAGEVAGKLSKVVRGDKEITGPARQAILDECGDVLWFLARLCDELDENLSEVARANLAKLRSRKERGVLKGDGDNR